MISYEPFFFWITDEGGSTYKLIKNHKISASLIQRMRDKKPISTRSIDKLARLSGCRWITLSSTSPTKKKNPNKRHYRTMPDL